MRASRPARISSRGTCRCFPTARASAFRRSRSASAGASRRAKAGLEPPRVQHSGDVMTRSIVPLVAVFSMLLIHELPVEAPPRLDEVLGIRSAAGAFVVSIDPASPAELAGLDVCELIAGFNGRDFRNY